MMTDMGMGNKTVKAAANEVSDALDSLESITNVLDSNMKRLYDRLSYIMEIKPIECAKDDTKEDQVPILRKINY